MIRYVRFLLLFYIFGSANAQVLIDYVVAVVNGDAVTRSELNNALNIAVIMGTSVPEAQTTAGRRAVLDTIINRELVLQESKRLGIFVTEREARVAEAITEIRRKYNSDGAFQIALQQHGVEDEALKVWIYEQLVYDEFFRRIFFNALNSAEIATLARSYYEANRTEFIVPPTIVLSTLSIVIPRRASETEKQKAEDLVKQLYTRLQQGETFETIRKGYETQLTIELEIFTLAIDTPLGVLASELPDTERSPLLRISDGYQVVERIQSNPARQRTYEEVSEEIIDRIQQEQAETAFAVWLAEQRKDVSWHILDDALKLDSETR